MDSLTIGKKRPRHTKFDAAPIYCVTWLLSDVRRTCCNKRAPSTNHCRQQRKEKKIMHQNELVDFGKRVIRRDSFLRTP